MYTKYNYKISYSYKNCTHINVIIFSIHTCIRVQFLYEYNSYKKRIITSYSYTGMYTKYNYKISYSYKNCTHINVIIFSIHTCIRVQFLYEYNSYKNRIITSYSYTGMYTKYNYMYMSTNFI